MARQDGPRRGARRPDRALDLLNFFLADMNGAFGPFLGVYLITEAGWNAAAIGLIGTLGGFTALAAQTPMGAFIDATRKKRALIILGASVLAVGASMIAFAPRFAVVLGAATGMALAGTIFGRAVVAISRGICPKDRLVRRLGRNAAFDHAGNVTIALIAAAVGSAVSQRAVFFLVPLCAVLAAGAVIAIPPRAIDHARARGLEDGAAARAHAPASLRVLLQSPHLLLFAACLALFHFANAPMLPLVGQKLALAHRGDATALMAACVIAAQLVMLPMALLVAARADRIGRKPLALAAFAVLPLRGALYTLSNDPFWLVGVQLLDGVGAGLLGALTPIFLADLTSGTGRYNMSQGAVATVQGVSVAISSAISGAIVVAAGYDTTFLVLAVVALVAFGTLLYAMPETRDLPGAEGSPQGNRVKVSRGDEACEEFVVPGGDLAPKA